MVEGEEHEPIPYALFVHFFYQSEYFSRTNFEIMYRVNLVLSKSQR